MLNHQQKLPPEVDGNNTKAHTQRVRYLGTLSPKQMHPENPSFPVSETRMDEEIERVKKPEKMENTKETRPSKHSRNAIQMKTQRLGQHEKGLNRSVPDWLLQLKEQIPPSLKQKVSQSINTCKRKFNFFLRECPHF